MAAAIAAALTAAGCDYWRNLVDEKTVTRAVVRIKVIDAFTRDPIPEAHCTDPDRGIDRSTDANGEFTLADAGTGPYSVTCTFRWGYYERTGAFEVQRGGADEVIALARHGGEEWYPDDELKQVKVRNLKLDTIRYPIRSLKMLAGPEDTSAPSRFLYLWSFEKYPELNRKGTSYKASSDTFELNTLPLAATITGGPDVLTLKVLSHLNGTEKEYEVGTFTKPFVWVRNLLPTLSWNDFSKAPWKVGCHTSQPLRLTFTGTDPDGSCKEVRIFNLDSNSTFGYFDSTFKCKTRSINLPLAKTFDTLSSDTSFEKTYSLNLSVSDDNGERLDTSLHLTVKSNILPKVNAEIEGRPSEVFTGEPVTILYDAVDPDGSIEQVTTVWEALSETIKGYGQYHVNTVQGRQSAVYSDTGRKTIIVLVEDECGDQPNYFLHVKVRKNIPPTAKLEFIREERDKFNDTTYRYFQFSISDKDVLDSLDHYSDIFLDWGDGSPMKDTTQNGVGYNKVVRHHYAGAPGPQGYTIRLDIHDAHGGRFVDSLAIPP
ncbi:MAG: hypothetical protein JWP91_816 [Fibrobacteres bacterium]|nr:hypothetical protein [Fibrobacterota bacterium]